MAILSDDLLRRMAEYGLPDRDGIEVPGTSASENPDLYEAACWNWAVAAGGRAPQEVESAEYLYDSRTGLLTRDQGLVRVVGLNEELLQWVDHYYPRASDAVNMLRGLIGDAMRRNQNAQNQCAYALMTIVAECNGLHVVGPATENSAYTVHMRTSRWSAWEHWALGVLLPDGQRSIVQKTSSHALQFNCTQVWDEHLEERALEVEELHDAHAQVLESIPETEEAPA